MESHHSPQIIQYAHAASGDDNDVPVQISLFGSKENIIHYFRTTPTISGGDGLTHIDTGYPKAADLVEMLGTNVVTGNTKSYLLKILLA